MGITSPSNLAHFDLWHTANIGTYLEIARRRKWCVILATLALFVLTTVVAYRLPDIYRSSTTILVDPQQIPDKYVPEMNMQNIADRLTTLEQQILSPTRLKRLVESEHLYPDMTGKRSEEAIVKGVQRSITVDAVNPGGAKLGTFKITYKGRRPEECARMANLIAKMFIEENLNARMEQAEGTTGFLKEQLEQSKRELEVKESQLRAVKTRNVLDLPESRPYHIESLTALRTQYQGIQERISQDQRERSILESMLASDDQAPTVSVDDGDGSSSPYQRQLQKLEGKLADLRTRYGSNYPDVRKTQREIDNLRAKAASEVQSAPPIIEQNSSLVLQKAARKHNPVVETQIEKLEEDIQAQSKLLPSIQAKIDFHTQKLEQFPAFEQQITSLQRDYDILKTRYTSLLDKKMAAEMSSALEIHQKGERFVVLDPAVAPEAPYGPNRILMSVAGFIGGLMAGIVLAFMAEMNDESVRSESEASQILGKAVLAAIPHIFSLPERRRRWLGGAGMITGTVVASVAFGFLLSIVAERLF